MDEKEFLKGIAMMFNKAPEEVTPSTTLKGDLGATSQMLFGVCAMAEQMSGKPVSYAALNNCETLQDLLDLLN